MEAFRTELSKQKTLVDKKRKRTNITTTSTKIFKYQYWQVIYFVYLYKKPFLIISNVIFDFTIWQLK